MRIAIVQQNYRIGDLYGNSAKILEAAAQAADKGAELVVFADGALTGSPLLELPRYDNFGNKAHLALNELAAKLPAELTVIVGISEIAAMPEDNIIVMKGGSYMCILGNWIDFTGQKVIFDLRSVPFSHGIAEKRLAATRKTVSDHDAAVICVNQAGASTDTIYFGGSHLCMPGGHYYTLPLFIEEISVIDTKIAGRGEPEWGGKIQQTYDALILGIRDYFVKSSFREACVALSGGLDSAVVTALAVLALGAENVRALLLPSGYSSSHSVDDSVEMAGKMKFRHDIIPIAPIYDEALKVMEPIFEGRPFCVAEENMQARIRCMLTMALSNKTGSLMLNTSNKSEEAVGYGTLYGDTAGAISVLGDLYKSEVKELAEYINRNYGDPIPRNIIDKAPSAELRPNQKDTDSLPEYHILDAILFRLIEQNMTLDEIVADGFPAEVVRHVANLVWSGDFKRRQSPPALRLSGATFGVERIMPIVKSKF